MFSIHISYKFKVFNHNFWIILFYSIHCNKRRSRCLSVLPWFPVDLAHDKSSGLASPDANNPENLIALFQSSLFIGLALCALSLFNTSLFSLALRKCLLNAFLLEFLNQMIHVPQIAQILPRLLILVFFPLYQIFGLSLQIQSLSQNALYCANFFHFFLLSL